MLLYVSMGAATEATTVFEPGMPGNDSSAMDIVHTTDTLTTPPGRKSLVFTLTLPAEHVR
jgi:hypothetical protein